MKITKRQLRRIIREEKSRILKEQFEGLDENDLYRFKDIMQEIQALTEEALEITKLVPDRSIEARAFRYWYGHIMSAAASDEYPNSFSTTMATTYEELEEYAVMLDEDGNDTGEW
tara:strand:- start:3100 stop:3444 length:345 start_codon:yes stop_codon:yes gene_type:complete